MIRGLSPLKTALTINPLDDELIDSELWKKDKKKLIEAISDQLITSLLHFSSNSAILDYFSLNLYFRKRSIEEINKLKGNTIKE